MLGGVRGRGSNPSTYSIGNDLKDLFVNREKEVEKIHNNANKPLIVISGKPGIGKTTVINKFIHETSYNTIEINLVAGSHVDIYQQILSFILIKMINRKIKYDKKMVKDIDLDDELLRVDYEMVMNSSHVLGLNKIIKDEKSEEVQVKYGKHTENTSKRLIDKLIKSFSEHVIIVIDDFDRIKYTFDHINQYIAFLMNTFSVVRNYFKNRNAHFVLCLEDAITKLIKQSIKEDSGVPSFNVSKYISIYHFNPKNIFKIINRRLAYAKSNISIDYFIDRDAFWSLYAASAGNPRLAFQILSEAMEEAKRNKQQKIQVKDIKCGIEENDLDIDPVILMIFSYLSEHGRTHANDKELHLFTGKSNKTLKKRLDILAENKQLQYYEEMVEKSNTKFYELIELNGE